MFDSIVKSDSDIKMDVENELHWDPDINATGAKRPNEPLGRRRV